MSMREKIHQKMMQSESDYPYWHPDVQRSLADAVLDALMKPTEEMLIIANADNCINPEIAWEVMIQAAKDGK